MRSQMVSEGMRGLARLKETGIDPIYIVMLRQVKRVERC